MSHPVHRVFDRNGQFVVPGNVKDILEPLTLRLPLKPRILDVGCNSSWVANFFEDYSGTDVDHQLIAWARAHWQKVGRWTQEEALNRLKLPQGETLDYPSSSFDAVILRDVLEHVETPLQLIAECSRVLKAGGLLLLSCPDSQPHVWDEPTHIRPYPLKAQRGLAALQGADIVYQGYESVLPGTQKIARLFGGRTPVWIRVMWNLPFWPRNAVSILRKR